LVFFTREVKRLFRAAWVLAANGFVAWGMCTRLASVGFNGHTRDAELWLEFLLEVVLPVAGIALELLNLKFARLVNVGSIAGAGSFWLADAIWWHSDPFFGVLLIVASGLLTIAGLTEVIYHRTKSDASATAR
jgi:hypothetical protein